MRRRVIVAVALSAACARKAETVDTGRAATDSSLRPTAAIATPDTSASKRDSGAAATGKKRSPNPPAESTKPIQAPPSDTSSVRATADTIRGIVAVVGTEHDKRIVIRPSNGRAITLTGSDAMLVGRAAGADVWVAGTRGERNTLDVREFAVRFVDGIAAVDGTLASDGGQLVLVTPDGKRHSIAHAPDALRQHVGGRVWISGNLSQGLVAYGVIREKP